MKTTIITFILSLGFGIGLSQDFSYESKEKMKAFESLTGTWKGTGWIYSQSGKQESEVTEEVSFRSGGTVLQMLGKGTKTVDGQQQTVHDALGVLYYDFWEKKYFVHSFSSKGMNALADVELIAPGKFKWWFAAGPIMTIRYTITFVDDIWTEVGEMSEDDENWRQFFEMKLQLVSK